MKSVITRVPVVTFQPTAFFLEQQFVDGVAQNVFRFQVGGMFFTFPATLIPQ